jgi:hypothetical protein
VAPIVNVYINDEFLLKVDSRGRSESRPPFDDVSSRRSSTPSSPTIEPKANTENEESDSRPRTSKSSARTVGTQTDPTHAFGGQHEPIYAVGTQTEPTHAIEVQTDPIYSLETQTESTRSVGTQTDPTYTVEKQLSSTRSGGAQIDSNQTVIRQEKEYLRRRSESDASSDVVFFRRASTFSDHTTEVKENIGSQKNDSRSRTLTVLNRQVRALDDTEDNVDSSSVKKNLKEPVLSDEIQFFEADEIKYVEPKRPQYAEIQSSRISFGQLIYPVPMNDSVPLGEAAIRSVRKIVAEINSRAVNALTSESSAEKIASDNSSRNVISKWPKVKPAAWLSTSEWGKLVGPGHYLRRK